MFIKKLNDTSQKLIDLKTIHIGKSGKRHVQLILHFVDFLIS